MKKQLLILTLIFFFNPLLSSRKPTQKLIRAIYANDAEKALQALKEGASINSRDAYGQTPLIKAIKFKACDTIINALLAREPDILAKTTMGETALHAAARAQNAEVCSILLRRGADRLAENIYGETPHSIAKTTPTTKRIFQEHKYQDLTNIYQIPEPEETDEKPSPRVKRLCIKIGDEPIAHRNLTQITPIQAADPNEFLSYGYESPYEFSPLINSSNIDID